jgi:hypothetical protein
MRASVLAVLVVAFPAFAQEEGFISLSDSPDLAGWRRVPGWSCADGVIRCEGRGGSLFSQALYEGFALRLEFKVPKGGNSGIYVRAPLIGRQSAIGMEMQILGDEARPRDAEACGAIYAARAPDVNAAKPPGEWNAVEIDLHGRALRVVMNGRVIHDISLDDPAVNASLPAGLKLSERLHRGFIALQYHGAALEFRNVRIKPDPEAGFEPLFADGLAGWVSSPPGAFSGADGAVTAAAPEGGEALLTCPNAWTDYALRLEYRVEKGAQGGIRLRTDPRVQRYTPVEVLIADDSGERPGINCSGALVGAAGVTCRGSRPPGEWNDMEIICRGRLVQVFVNAAPVLSANTNLFGRYIQAPLKGAPEVRVRKSEVQLRNVRLRPLGG